MIRFKFLSKSKISKLPGTAGVYCFKQKNNILYIGKAISIKSRVKNHFQQPSYRDKLFITKVNKVGFLETGSEIEALILEANLIKKYQPKYNVMWRDDKNYFYVAIAKNKDKIPYVYITHQPKKLNPEPYTLNPIYIGPFTEGTALKKTLKFLRRAFPHYTSSKHQKTKCTWCHLDLCPGPLLDLPAYKKNIKKLTLILQGKKSAVLNSLKKEMKQLSKEKKFEKAGKIRDRIYALQQIMAHAHVIGNSKDNNGGFLPYGKKPPLPALKILQKIIGIKKPITRIECYDVSNIQGKHATGSMIVFIDGKPEKSQYRKFKIKMKNEPNDVAMLKEILQRRFNHPEWGRPDAVLIDGGKAQLNAAIASKPRNSKIKIISIAKGRQDPLRPRSEARLFIENKKNPIPLKSLPREVYNLIKQLDGEAHRFAIAYHKKLRRRKMVG